MEREKSLNDLKLLFSVEVFLVEGNEKLGLRVHVRNE